MILELIGYAALGTLAADFFATLDLPEIPNKPFKCDMCMGFWISIIPLTICYGLIGVLYAATSGVLADVLFRIKQRL